MYNPEPSLHRSESPHMLKFPQKSQAWQVGWVQSYIFSSLHDASHVPR